MNLTKISVKLAYMLRHCVTPMYIDPKGGWADVETIIAALRKYDPQVDRTILERIVADDSKGRYSFSKDGTKIRANQGHSIPDVEIEMETVDDPPEFVYHGTATRFLESIMRSGLKSMSRRFVHLSPDPETAEKVGKRHGRPVILKVEAARFVSDGHRLYISSNGVYQAEDVPAEYISILRYC